MRLTATSLVLYQLNIPYKIKSKKLSFSGNFNEEKKKVQVVVNVAK